MTAVTNEAVMALISDQALTRHQYQRRMKTSAGAGAEPDQELPTLLHAA